MSLRFLLFFFFLLFWINLSESSIPTLTINADVVELVDLNEAFRRNSPAIFHRIQSLLCEMINTCCPSVKSNLHKYISSTFDGSDRLINECIGNRLHQSTFDDCPTVLKFQTISTDHDFLEFANVLTSIAIELQSSDIFVPQVCSSEEIYSLLCDWTKRNKTESCMRKTLVYVSEHRSDDDYRTFVQKNKHNLRVMINAMNKAYPMQNTTKTMTSGATVNVDTNRSLLLSTSTTQIPNTTSTSSQKTVQTLIISLTLLLALFFH